LSSSPAADRLSACSWTTHRCPQLWPWSGTASTCSWSSTTTLTEVIAGTSLARTQPDETVLYLEPGIFPWDTALATFAYTWARKHGIGTHLNL
jgi:ornithine cyclodeaminase/alanine dehydrogenase-like protein (mu-crystallin family)